MSYSFRQRKGLSRRRFLTLGLGGAGGVLLADSLWYEPQALKIERHKLHSASQGKKVRIVQISDLHLSDFNGYFEDVSRQVADLKPDLILLTGDYLEEERNIWGVRSFLEKLKAKGRTCAGILPVSA